MSLVVLAAAYGGRRRPRLELGIKVLGGAPRADPGQARPDPGGRRPAPG